MNQHKKYSKVLFKPHLILIVLVTSLFTGCVSSPDPETPLQTRILEVKVEPNPVVVGDTTTFTCIIADSLDKRFQFGWGIEGDGSLKDTITTEGIFKWKAPDETGEYLHTVRVDNGSEPDSVAPGRSFTVTVVEE